MRESTKSWIQNCIIYGSVVMIAIGSIGRRRHGLPAFGYHPPYWLGYFTVAGFLMIGTYLAYTWFQLRRMSALLDEEGDEPDSSAEDDPDGL